MEARAEKHVRVLGHRLWSWTYLHVLVCVSVDMQVSLQ